MIDDVTELGSMVQKEDNGTYTAIAAFTGLDDKYLAEELSNTMVEAINSFLNQRGVGLVKKMMQ